MAVEGSAIPGYGQLQKLHIPLTGSHLGYSDILPKYANATGGEIFSGFSRDAIESTYASALGEARNQYTLGYMTHATPSNTHREIEVRVSRPDLKVTAKEGYYPDRVGSLNLSGRFSECCPKQGAVFQLVT